AAQERTEGAPVDFLPRSVGQPTICRQAAGQDEHPERRAGEAVSKDQPGSPCAGDAKVEVSKGRDGFEVAGFNEHGSLSAVSRIPRHGAVHARRRRYSSTPDCQEGNSCPVTSRKSRQSSTVRPGLRAARETALSSFSSGTVRPAFEST